MNTDLLAQRAIDRLHRSGFEALTEMEKTLATVWLFEAEVANNGFSHYFASGRGDLAMHAPTALRAIGAHRLAEIAAEANAQFGPDGPPVTRDERRRRLKSLPESARARFAELEKQYHECEDDADALLETMIEGHAAGRTEDEGQRTKD